jgi:benzoyl-CoA reductase subunit C
MLQEALDEAGIPHTSFKYAENTAQFHAIHEQSGTFADSIKLWSEAS